jgi:hypothetical protein
MSGCIISILIMYTGSWRFVRRAVAIHGGRTILLIDLLLYVEVNARNDYVGDDVESAYTVQDIWVIERYLL